MKNTHSTTSVRAFQPLKNNRGQLVIEYVLLLIVTVSLAATLISTFANRGDNPGFFVAKWNGMMRVIGNDLPDRKK